MAPNLINPIIIIIFINLKKKIIFEHFNFINFNLWFSVIIQWLF